MLLAWLNDNHCFALILVLFVFLLILVEISLLWSIPQGDPAAALADEKDGLENAEDCHHISFRLVIPVVVERAIGFHLVSNNVEPAEVAQRTETSGEDSDPSGQVTARKTAVTYCADKTGVPETGSTSHQSEVDALNDHDDAIEGPHSRPTSARLLAGIWVIFAVLCSFKTDLIPSVESDIRVSYIARNLATIVRVAQRGMGVLFIDSFCVLGPVCVN